MYNLTEKQKEVIHKALITASDNGTLDEFTNEELKLINRAETIVNKLTIPVVGWRSEQLPTFDIDDINEIIEDCKENKDSLEALISRIWNRGLITGVNSEAEINSK